MIRIIVFYIAFLVTVSLGFPAEDKTVKNEPETKAVASAHHDDLQTAETFYSGYSGGYPGLGGGLSLSNGLGWKGGNGYPNVISSGAGIGVGLGGGYVGGYGGVGGVGGLGGIGSFGGIGGGYGPGYGTEYGGYSGYAGYRLPPPVTGGYGWKQGPNRWSLV